MKSFSVIPETKQNRLKAWWENFKKRLQGKKPKSGEKATGKDDESTPGEANGTRTIENADNGQLVRPNNSARDYYGLPKLLRGGSLSNRGSHNNHGRADVESYLPEQERMSIRSKRTG